MKDTKKQFDRQNNYNKENYDRVGTVLPRGSKERIKEKAAQTGETVNAYLKRIILESLEK